MVIFYRNFIPNCSNVCKPLNMLTKNNTPLNWTEKCESAFLSLKSCLTSYPLHAFPKLNETFYVEVDVSNSAVGGVLTQVNKGGKSQPVTYFSKALQKSQKNCSTHPKEASVLIVAVRQWHVYLMGREFVIKTDHNPLVHLRNTKDPRGKIARWINELEEFTYRIEYRTGKSNVVVDALSRDLGAVTHPFNEDSEWEEKLYSISEMEVNESFQTQLIDEQNKHPLIKRVKECVRKNTKINDSR